MGVGVGGGELRNKAETKQPWLPSWMLFIRLGEKNVVLYTYQRCLSILGGQLLS